MKVLKLRHPHLLCITVMRRFHNGALHGLDHAKPPSLRHCHSSAKRAFYPRKCAAERLNCPYLTDLDRKINTLRWSNPVMGSIKYPAPECGTRCRPGRPKKNPAVAGSLKQLRLGPASSRRAHAGEHDPEQCQDSRLGNGSETSIPHLNHPSQRGGFTCGIRIDNIQAADQAE